MKEVTQQKISDRLLSKKNAAAKLDMPRSTFDEKYEELGLYPLVLDPSFKSSERWLESEIDEFIEKRKQERDEALIKRQQKTHKAFSLVDRKISA